MRGSDRPARRGASMLVVMTLVMASALTLTLIVAWSMVQPYALPAHSRWRVTNAEMTGMGQLVIGGFFDRRWDDHVCKIDWIRFYGSDGIGSIRLDVQALSSRNVAPETRDKPAGTQSFGPIAIDTSRAPGAYLLKGKTRHVCFGLGPFPGIGLVTFLPDYDFNWLISNRQSPL